MREVSIIVQRELRSYFASPIAYVFGGLFLLVLCYLSVDQMLRQDQQANMQGFFGLLPIVFLFFLPALTMRLWAEERKLGTLELLMTFPVSLGKLIAGKFVASMLFLVLVVALTLGLPVTMWIYGGADGLDLGPLACQYLGVLLLASSYVAVGMFCSSVTRDQLVAMLMTLVILLVLTLLGDPRQQVWLATWLPAWAVNGAATISPTPYFDSIARGVLDSRDFLFYICFCGFFLHMNALVLQSRKLKG